MRLTTDRARAHERIAVAHRPAAAEGTVTEAHAGAQAHPPIWVMGLTNALFGMMGGFAVVTLPQLLAAEGIPGGHIAAITATIISPGFWAFVLSPMLDVRLRRRTYALIFGATAALAAAFTVLHHGRVAMVELVMLIGYLSAALYQGAVGGWMGSLISHEEDSRLGTWFSVANIGSSGLIIVAGGSLILHAPRALAAAFTLIAMLVPTVLFLFIPAPLPDKVLASESFGRFGRSILDLLRRREVLIGLALFILPSASFALTNVLGGIGKDYHASATTVSLFAGTGSIVAGLGGSFLVPRLARRIELRRLYLLIGIVGAVFTLAALLLPRAPWTFGVVFTGEIIFQALAFTAAFGIAFQIIGPGNPLAATIFTVLIAALNLPIVYSGMLDGWGYDRGGLAGSFVMDAGVRLVSCILLAIVLRRWLFAPRPTPLAEPALPD
jgi:PAT family beta-lactamase induction signal transducer AmpG